MKNIARIVITASFLILWSWQNVTATGMGGAPSLPSGTVPLPSGTIPSPIGSQVGVSAEELQRAAQGGQTLPCDPIYTKLSSINECPADANNQCIHFHVVLENKPNGVCSFHTPAAPGTEVVGYFEGVQLHAIRSYTAITLASNSRFAFLLDDIVGPNNFASNNEYFTMRYEENGVQKRSRIVFDRIDYSRGQQGGINIPGVGQQGLPTPIAQQPTAGPANPVAGGGNPPVVDPNLPPPDEEVPQSGDDVEGLQASEPALGSSSCSFYPHAGLDGWWPIGGLILLTLTALLTPRLVRSKSRRRR